MIETEVKIAVAGPRRGRQMLRGAGFSVARRRVFEVNIVLDTPASELRQSARLLRLRQAGRTSTLTVKGPPIPGRHKKRPEFETTVADFASTLSLLEVLGYRQTFRYEKFRTEFAITGETGHAVLDETPIGTFLELEGPGRWIDATARRLGIRPAEYINDSYGALYLAFCRSNGIKPGNMIFQGHPEK